MTRSNDPRGNNQRKVDDWSTVPLLAIDSRRTRLVEDGIAVRELPRTEGNWSADLKVAYTLPLHSLPSLTPDERQLCMGITDFIVRNRGLKPAISLVVAKHVSQLTDSQANAILTGRGRDVCTLRNGSRLTQEMRQELKRGLAALRSFAKNISGITQGTINAEHAVFTVTDHVQRAATRAIRSFDRCPPVVVLRPESSRTASAGEAQQKGPFHSHMNRPMVVAGVKYVPTLLATGETAQEHDSLRFKERGNSGAINSTQIICALLGIKPLAEDIVRLGLRKDSDFDRWKKGGPLPEKLKVAIQQKRNEIREVLLRLL